MALEDIIRTRSTAQLRADLAYIEGRIDHINGPSARVRLSGGRQTTVNDVLLSSYRKQKAIYEKILRERTQ